MNAKWTFLITLICATIGSTVGAYVGFKLYPIYGPWALLGVVVIMGFILLILAALLTYLMKRPAMRILKYEDPEDIEEPK